MTVEQIEKFLETKNIDSSRVQISFKDRQPIQGIFLKTGDYTSLKSKNLWRIVSESRIAEYNVSKNTDLARIFNGNVITRLTLV